MYDMIVIGGGSARKSGLLARVTDSLNKSGILYCLLEGVKPNPEDTKVYEGIELARKENVNFLLPVGGGSAIDVVEALREAGAEVLGIVSIFTYGMEKMIGERNEGGWRRK